MRGIAFPESSRVVSRFVLLDAVAGLSVVPRKAKPPYHVLQHLRMQGSIEMSSSWWWQCPRAKEAEGPNVTWSLSELAERFFPSVPLDEREAYSYPLPLAPESWRLYSEPVDDFLHRAGWLQKAIENIAPADSEGESDFWWGKEILDFLTASANRVLRPSGGRLELVWLFPSLLASFGMMVAEDTTEEHAVHICPMCETPFLSKAYQARFCSDTCRYRHQKREQRRRKGT
jgi:hypothetical protein